LNPSLKTIKSIKLPNGEWDDWLKK
jgi:hypothetical protein